jgi:hypothetical protein
MLSYRPLYNLSTAISQPHPPVCSCLTFDVLSPLQSWSAAHTSRALAAAAADMRLFAPLQLFAVLRAASRRHAVQRPSVLTPMCASAVGDIHGDLAKAVNALKVAGLMDDDSGQPVWTGGNAVCVQMGDVLDRGDQEIGASRRVSRSCNPAPPIPPSQHVAAHDCGPRRRDD